MDKLNIDELKAAIGNELQIYAASQRKWESVFGKEHPEFHTMTKQVLGQPDIPSAKAWLLSRAKAMQEEAVDPSGTLLRCAAGHCFNPQNQDKVSDDNDDDKWVKQVLTMTEEDEKKASDWLIQREKEMMAKYKGTEWGDWSAHDLFQSLLCRSGLPQHDVALPFDAKTHTVTLVWTKPKAARIDVAISSVKPEARVYLGKLEPEPAVSYEEALDTLKAYFTT